jgi:hypothetical protein
MAFGFIILSQQVYSWFLIPLLQRVFCGDTGSSRYSSAGAWKILKCFIYLVLGVGLSSLMTINPSLALAIAIPLIPICIICRPSQSLFFLVIQSSVLVVTSPPVLLVIYALYSQDIGVVNSTIKWLYESWSTFGGSFLPWVVWFYWPLNLALQLLVTMEN